MTVRPRSLNNLVLRVGEQEESLRLIKTNLVSMTNLTETPSMAIPNGVQLLGPPQIHKPTATKPNAASAEPPPMPPCADFFLKPVPNTPPKDFIKLLEKSWTHHPLTTLKLICNLRSHHPVTGNPNREGFYAAALWLHKNHPKTLAVNLTSIAKLGCLKDLLEVLYRIMEGSDVRSNAKEERERKKKAKVDRMCRSCGRPPMRKNKPCKRIKFSVSREARVLASKAKNEEAKKRASELREEKKVEKAKRAFEKYRKDSDYRFLHDRTSDIFADLLRCDIENLKLGRIDEISLASKWCPSLDSSYDKSTLICESIAKRVFPRESCSEYEVIEEAHYVYRVRDRLRKEVLVPLRKALELPEVYMSARQWESVPYDRVSSVSMRRYKKLFLRHDNKRFIEYLEAKKKKKSEKGEKSKPLFPHKIIASVEKVRWFHAMPWDENNSQTVELQWKKLKQDFLTKGSFGDCIAVCDVSGSMGRQAMNVCVALGLLVSELSDDPWEGKVISFHRRPKLHKIEGTKLKSKVRLLKEMESGHHIDFQRVFKRILEVGYYGKLRDEEMIERVFVFSNMEFDRASKYDWETEYRAIRTKFRKYGFNKVPELVFWNLGASKATLVPSKREGVVLVDGFSKKMLNLFLEKGGEMNANALTQSAISGEKYNNLVVVD